MKKIVSLLLAVMMTGALLTGCGGASDKSKGMSGSTQEAEAAQAKAPEDSVQVKDNAYVVMVQDSEGTPVKGATVQFCSDTMCLMQKTDETGIATFEQEPGIYTIHILKVPEGYVKPEEEFKTTEEYGLTMVTLEKK